MQPLLINIGHRWWILLQLIQIWFILNLNTNNNVSLRLEHTENFWMDIKNHRNPTPKPKILILPTTQIPIQQSNFTLHKCPPRLAIKIEETHSPSRLTSRYEISCNWRSRGRERLRVQPLLFGWVLLIWLPFLRPCCKGIWECAGLAPHWVPFLFGFQIRKSGKILPLAFNSWEKWRGRGGVELSR